MKANISCFESLQQRANDRMMSPMSVFNSVDVITVDDDEFVSVSNAFVDVLNAFPVESVKNPVELAKCLGGLIYLFSAIEQGGEVLLPSGLEDIKRPLGDLVTACGDGSKVGSLTGHFCNKLRELQKQGYDYKSFKSALSKAPADFLRPLNIQITNKPVASRFTSAPSVLKNFDEWFSYYDAAAPIKNHYSRSAVLDAVKFMLDRSKKGSDGIGYQNALKSLDRCMREIVEACNDKSGDGVESIEAEQAVKGINLNLCLTLKTKREMRGEDGEYKVQSTPQKKSAGDVFKQWVGKGREAVKGAVEKGRKIASKGRDVAKGAVEGAKRALDEDR